MRLRKARSAGLSWGAVAAQGAQCVAQHEAERGAALGRSMRLHVGEPRGFAGAQCGTAQGRSAGPRRGAARSCARVKRAAELGGSVGWRRGAMWNGARAR